MSSVIVTELDNVAYVKLNRPEVRNSFNPEMIDLLTKTFLDLDKRTDLKAVVLQGEGKVFCAGADLSWMKDMVNFSFEQNREDSLKLFDMFQAILMCSLPVIGLVHGAAFGGALGLVACCDDVIAEENAQLCFSEVKLGIAPAVISAFVNLKAVAGKVRPLMLSGRVFDAHTAQQSGLVTQVVPVSEGGKALQHVLHGYLQCGPQAVRETKKLLLEVQNLKWLDQRARTATVIAERRVSKEGQEGLKSFLEKRDPSWRQQ